MGLPSRGTAFAAPPSVRHAAIASAVLLACHVPAARGDEKKPSPCTEDAMIVFDASGSMSGNQTLGIPNSRARIDEVRAALAQVLPSATKIRRVGLVTYGPGPYNQCNVKLEFTNGRCRASHHAHRGCISAGWQNASYVWR